MKIGMFKNSTTVAQKTTGGEVLKKYSKVETNTSYVTDSV